MFIGFLPGQYFVPPTPLPPGIPSPPIAPPSPPPPGVPGTGFLPKILGPLGGALLDILFNPAPTQNEDEFLQQLNNPANLPLGSPVSPGTFTTPPPFSGGQTPGVVYTAGGKVWVQFVGYQGYATFGIGNLVGPITFVGLKGQCLTIEAANGSFQVGASGVGGPCSPDYLYVYDIVIHPKTEDPPFTPQPLAPPIWEINFPPEISPLGTPQGDPFSPLPDFAPYDPINPNNPFTAPGGDPYAPSPLPGAPPLGNPPPYLLPGLPGVNQESANTNFKPSPLYDPSLLPQVLPSPIIFPGTKPPTLPDPATQPQLDPVKPLLPISPTNTQTPPIDTPPGNTGKPNDKPPIPKTPDNLAPGLTPDPSKTPDPVIQKNPLPPDDCCDEILAQLAIIQNKLGDPIPEGLSGAAESLMFGSATNRYLIMNMLSIGLHNAAMLSSDLPKTLLPAANFFLAQPSFHYIKGDQTKIIPFFTAAKSTEGTFNAGLAAPNLSFLNFGFETENRIAIVGNNLFRKLIVLFESVLTLVARVNQTVAKIGNALIKSGGLVDDNDNYFPEILEIFSPDFGFNIIPSLSGMIPQALNGKATVNFDPVVNPAPVPEILANKSVMQAQLLVSTQAIKTEIALSEVTSTTPNIEIEDVWGTP